MTAADPERRRSSPASIYRGLRRALRAITHPVRRDRGLEGMVVHAYRGYGTPREVYMMGRVFRQPTFGARLPDGTLRRQLADAARRFARFGLHDATVSARLGCVETTVRTDRDGYFQIALQMPQHPDPGRLWHDIALVATWKDRWVEEIGHVYIPPPEARFVVISDIDDTVMFTGVANKAGMMWRLFVQSAESRVAFPGVAALYRALHSGNGGDENNPMLFVSRGPWSIYEVLERFFRLHRIPVGPILFLREWGLTLQRPLPRRAQDHKRDLILGMLARYDDLPFILIGDSGQHDPETYARIVEEHPGRVLAVYIRNVSPGEARAGEIDELARRTTEAGCPLVLASDSLAMAKHAAAAGWISPEAAGEVSEERVGAGVEPITQSLVAVPAEHAEDAARSEAKTGELRDVVVEE